MLVGFSGVAFIFRDGLDDLLDPNYQVGMLCIAFAISGWAAGTIYTKKHTLQSSNIFLDLFYQFTFSALVQIALAFCLSPVIEPTSWSIQSIAAVGYLAVFGSVIGYV